MDTLHLRRPKLEQKSGQKPGFTKNVGEDTDIEAELVPDTSKAKKTVDGAGGNHASLWQANPAMD